MAGRPRAKLQRILGLLERAEALLNDYDAIMPAMYRPREAGAGDDPIAQGWNWGRESIDGARTELRWLAALLQEKVSMAKRTVGAGADDNSNDPGEPISAAGNGTAGNTQNEDRGAFRRSLQARGEWPEFCARRLELLEQEGMTPEGAWRKAARDFAGRFETNAGRRPSMADESVLDRLSAMSWAEIIAQVAAEDRAMTVDQLRERLWVYEQRSRTDVSEADAPSPKAWKMLQVVSESPVTTSKPWLFLAGSPEEAERIAADYRSRIAAAGVAEA